MGKNFELTAIMNNLPEYEKCRSEFFQHYNLFLMLGVVNYAALGSSSGMAGPVHEIVGIFLAGYAMGKGSEIAEREGSELTIDYWDPIEAWKLVESKLSAIRPDLPKLPAAAEYSVPSTIRVQD